MWSYVHGLQALRTQAKAEGFRLYVEGSQASKSQAEGLDRPATQSPHGNADEAIPNLLKHMEEWAWKGILATATGGAALGLALLLGAASVRRGWKRGIQLSKNPL